MLNSGFNLKYLEYHESPYVILNANGMLNTMRAPMCGMLNGGFNPKYLEYHERPYVSSCPTLMHVEYHEHSKLDVDYHEPPKLICGMSNVPNLKC